MQASADSPFFAERELVTTREAAHMLGVSMWTVRRFVKLGWLRPVRFGEQGEGPFRFPIEDVRALFGRSTRRDPVLETTARTLARLTRTHPDT